MTTNANISPIAVGINEVREGAQLTASGVAHIAEGIIAAELSPMRWSYGEGDNLMEGFFNLRDMFRPVRGPDGAVDSKVLPAMYRAVATEFGVEGEFTSGDKVQFKRGWQIAAAKFAGVDVGFCNVEVMRAGKKVKVRAVEVPAEIAFDLYKDDGGATEAGKVFEADARRMLKRLKKSAEPADVVEAAKSTMVECVGGKFDGVKVPSVTDIANRLAAFAVDAGLMPAPKSRDRDGQDKGKAFVESLDMVTASLELLRTSEESNFAPSDAIDEKLHKLQAELVAYFDFAATLEVDLLPIG